MKRRWQGLALVLSVFVLGITATVAKINSRSGEPEKWESLSPALQRAFTAGPEIDEMPKPGPSDWLASRRESGQTYAEFLKSRPNKPGAQGRRFIYLQPLGEFPDEAPSLEKLQEFMSGYYHPMKVKMMAPLEITRAMKVRSREHFGNQQWNCRDLLKLMGGRVPRDAHVVMGVTMTDLYPGDDWNFVFGMAQLKKRVGVFSFARFGDDPQLAMVRAMKVIAHETGHAFGIRHCIAHHCLMNGSNGLDESDRAPLHFCPVCLRKLHWGLKFDPVERYEKIGEFLLENEMVVEAKWFSARATSIAETKKRLPEKVRGR